MAAWVWQYGRAEAHLTSLPDNMAPMHPPAGIVEDTEEVAVEGDASGQGEGEQVEDSWDRI